VNLFLIGAGFDKAATGGKAPLNRELLGKLKQFGEIWISGVQDLIECLRRYPTDDIEKCMTFLDMQIKNKRARGDGDIDLRLQKWLRRALARYFQQQDFCFQRSCLQDAPWLGTFAEKSFSADDMIVNLNYSCFFEGLLDRFEMWSPLGGYSQSILELVYADEDKSRLSVQDLPKKNEGLQNLIVYKIHGSANFVEKGAEIAAEVSSGFFPSISIACYASDPSGRSYWQGGPPYVIAPSFVKIPHVQIGQMMVEVLDRVREARNFVVIGCSLRPEDGFLWLMLTQFFEHWRGRGCRGKIIVVDKDAKGVSERVRSYFQAVHESALSDGILKPLGCVEDSVGELIDLLKPSSSG